MNKFKSLLKDEQGQGMTEYGLVLGLIAVAVVGALVLLRGHIIALFEGAEATVGEAAATMAPSAT